MREPIAGIMKIFLFQKSNIEVAMKTELIVAVRTSNPPILSCNFNTKIERISEERKERAVYSWRETPILKKAFRRR